MQKILIALMTGLLVTVGLSDPSQGAGQYVQINKADVVQNGSKNSDQVVATISNLNLAGTTSSIQRLNVGFVSGGKYSNKVTNTTWNGDAGVATQCGNSGVYFKISQTISGSCYVSDTYAEISLSSGSVGTTVEVTFAIDSLTFTGESAFFMMYLNGNYNYTGTGKYDFNLTKKLATQPTPLSVISTSGSYGSALPLSTSGGDGGGAVTYVVRSGTAQGCSVSSGLLSSTSAGTCFVTATKAGDSIYSSTSSAETEITFSKLSRSLSFGSTTNYTLAYGATQTVVATPSAGVDDGIITYSVSTGTACSVGSTSGIITVTASTGSCVVSASISAGTNYLKADTSTQVSVNGTVRTITIKAASSSVNFGTTPSQTLSVTTGKLVESETIDNESTTFEYTGTNGTVYGPSTILPQNAGTYSVVPSNLSINGGSASNYNVTYLPGTLTINKASRTLTFASTVFTLSYGETQDVSATPSAGDGTISYSAGSSTACEVDSVTGKISVFAGSGTCNISASITEDNNHLSAFTTNQVNITVTKRAVTITASSPTVMQGTTFTKSFEVTSGTLAGSDAIEEVEYLFAGTGSTTYASSTTAPTAIGTYSITPAAATFSSGKVSNYTISYAVGVLTITSKNTRTLSFATLSYNLEYGETITVNATTSAGATDGVISYSKGDSTACIVDTSTGEITVISPSGTCIITAAITEGKTHVAATTANGVIVTVNPRAITISANSSQVAYGSPFTPSFTITSGSLAGSDDIAQVNYAYEVDSSGNYEPSSRAPEMPGKYSLIPSKAIFSKGLATNYDISYAAGTLIISDAPEVTSKIELSVPIGSMIFGSPLKLSASGLEPSAAYSIVVRSTPQTIASGFAVGGVVNSTATVPDGLEAGWHSITFSSTAADGSVVEDTLYFKISASGMLLSTSGAKPTVLASTGFNSSQPLGLGFFSILIGFGLMLLLDRRKKNS